MLQNFNPKIFLAVWIYLGWFGCVYFGKMGWETLSLFFPLVSWKLLQMSFRIDHHVIFRLFILLLTGLVFDSAGVYFGLIELSPPAENGWLTLWLIALWLLFASSLPLLQSLFQKKYFLAGLLGAIFGPLSYQAGTQFGTLRLNGPEALFIYSVFWAIYIPSAIFWLGKKDITNEKI